MDHTCILDLVNILEAEMPPIINTNIEILEKTLKTLAHDIDLRTEIGILSRKYMEKYYNTQKFIEKLENFYNNALNNQKIVEKSLLNTKTRKFFKITMPDIMYDYRKEKYQEK